MAGLNGDSKSHAEPPAEKRNEWESLPPMAIQRAFAGGICVNDHQFLVIGGAESFENDGARLHSCEYYDTITETWRGFPINMPTPRMGFGVARVGNEVFVVGGNDGPESYRSDVIAIDYSGGDLSTISMSRSWRRRPSMNEARSLFACVSHSTNIYVFGGLDCDQEAMYTAEVYDTQTKQWTQLPDMPGKRYGSAAGVVGNKIYVVGGFCDEVDESSALASIVVFDISTQQWESSDTAINADATPDMNTKRGNLSVVVVDRFVIAIGGYDEGENTLSTIEILDTKRKAWSFTPTPMNNHRSYLVAGLWEETNKVIVAGGSEYDYDVMNMAECIRLENGLLPAHFRFKERGQKVVTDIDQGEDQLGLTTIAEALAETLVFKDTESPFVLGLLGRSGRGKSYFFNLMLDHIINLQKRPVDKVVRETFAGHIYIVKYDAWMLSKGNIWTNLIYQILKTLNEQLQIEEIMGNKILEVGTESPIEVFRNLSTGDPKVLESYQAIQKNSDLPSERLLKVINPNYEQDRKKLEEIETRIQATSAMKEIGSILNFLGRKKLGMIEEQHGGNIDDLIKGINSIKTKWYYTFKTTNIPYFGIFSSALLVIGAICFAMFGFIILAIVTGVLAIVIPVVTSVIAASKEIKPLVSKIGKQDAAAEDLEIGTLDDHELTELKIIKKEIESRTLVRHGQSLQNTIATKMASEDDSSVSFLINLQRDLQLISDGMLNKSHTDIFPRGDPRIILFVDNLDCCEHREVVWVMEALQLLVKTKLCVSVLAVDPRYATLSLNKHYEGKMDSKTQTDFLEKLIQIPFLLPRVGRGYIDAFVKSQIDIEKPQHVPKNGKNGSKTAHTIAATDASSSQFLKSPKRQKEEEEVVPLPCIKVPFTEEEASMMAECFKLSGMNPRSMRRVINVFKMLKVIWKRDGRRFDGDMNVKRARLFLLILATDESTREATFKVFELMETGTVKYHPVMMNGDGVRLENNLAQLMKTELLKSDENFALTVGLESTKEGALMGLVDKYLAEYRWDSREQWDAISSAFLLARCFSYYIPPVNQEIDDSNRTASTDSSTPIGSPNRIMELKNKLNRLRGDRGEQ